MPPDRAPLPGPSPAPGDQLRQLCERIASVLHAGAAGAASGSLLAGIEDSLLAVLRQRLRAATAGVRRDLESALDAVADLERLAEAGEKGPVLPAAPPPLLLFPPRSEKDPLKPLGAPGAPAPDPAAAVAEASRPAPAAEAPLLAAERVERGDALRRQGDAAGAVEEYSRALELAPGCAAACLGRGLAFGVMGQRALALADLDAAARLEPSRAEVFFCRGRVRLDLGQHRGAASDFAAAARLQPGSTPARYYLAVASRLAGQAERAIEVLTDLLHQTPADARLHFQRGAAYADRREWPRAEADLARALELAPDLTEARQRLEEVRQAAAPPTPPAPPSPSPSGPPAACDKPVPAAPMLPASRRKRPASAGHVSLCCPRCGAVGQVSPDRLHRLFQCKGCGGTFHVHPNGRVEAFRPRRPENGPRRVRWAIALALLLGGLILVTWRATRSPAMAAEAPLPADLEPRAELFARAWLAQDVPRMRRLTDPARDNHLYPWLVRHPPPAVDPAGLESELPAGVALRLRLEPTGAGATRVGIHIDGLPAPAPSLTQDWVERGGAWYFVPPVPGRR